MRETAVKMPSADVFMACRGIRIFVMHFYNAFLLCFDAFLDRTCFILLNAICGILLVLQRAQKGRVHGHREYNQKGIVRRPFRRRKEIFQGKSRQRT